MQNKIWSISELAKEFAISARTIRFYEDKGLLNPQRAGMSRIYNYKDRARLTLILRGKRLGFSLEEIKEYLSLYHVNLDPKLSDQLNFLSNIVTQKVEALRQQQQDLETMINELLQVKAECQTILNQRSHSNSENIE